jgi:hypothetical protein
MPVGMAIGIAYHHAGWAVALGPTLDRLAMVRSALVPEPARVA